MSTYTLWVFLGSLDYDVFTSKKEKHRREIPCMQMGKREIKWLGIGENRLKRWIFGFREKSMYDVFDNLRILILSVF